MRGSTIPVLALLFNYLSNRRGGLESGVRTLFSKQLDSITFYLKSTCIFHNFQKFMNIVNEIKMDGYYRKCVFQDKLLGKRVI